MYVIKSMEIPNPDLNRNHTIAVQYRALRWCVGKGIDYGYGDAALDPGCPEYILPGATGVDRGVIKFHFGAEIRHADISHLNFGDKSILGDSHGVLDNLDYIFSSHALQYISEWPETLTYWQTRLRLGGIIYLYLPHFSYKPWLPINFSAHKWTPSVRSLDDHMITIGCEPVEYLDGADREGSFFAVYRKTNHLFRWK